MKNEYREFQRRIINLFIEHPEVKKVWNTLDSRRMFRQLGVEEDSDETPLHLFLMGKSRVGKSVMVKKYVKSVKRYVEVDEEGTKVDIVPVAYMDLPVPFTVGAFYNKIIKSLGAVRSPGDPKVDFLKERAFGLLKKQKVEMLIIDELDYLLASTYVNKKQAMEQIKNLTNETDVCLVCVGTPAIEELRTLNEQHIGRYPPKTVPWFKECDESFYNLLEEIENQLGLNEPLGLSDKNSVFAEILHELSGGLIGWLKPILREAFNIVGVFEPDFNDFSILKRIDGDILIQARDNILGELSEDQFNKFIEKDKE